MWLRRRQESSAERRKFSEMSLRTGRRATCCSCALHYEPCFLLVGGSAGSSSAGKLVLATWQSFPGGPQPADSGNTPLLTSAAKGSLDLGHRAHITGHRNNPSMHHDGETLLLGDHTTFMAGGMQEGTCGMQGRRLRGGVRGYAGSKRTSRMSYVDGSLR